MHELSIAEALIDQLRELLDREGASKITKISLEIGEMCGVQRDPFEFAFPIASDGSPAEGAELEIREVDVQITCGACGLESHPEYPMILCGQCGSLNVEVTDGKEFKIKSVEVY